MTFCLWERAGPALESSGEQSPSVIPQVWEMLTQERGRICAQRKVKDGEFLEPARGEKQLHTKVNHQKTETQYVVAVVEGPN